MKNVEKKTDATFVYRIRSRFGFNIFFFQVGTTFDQKSFVRTINGK